MAHGRDQGTQGNSKEVKCHGLQVRIFSFYWPWGFAEENVVFRGLMPCPTERVVHHKNTIQADAPTTGGQTHQPKSLVRNFMFWNMSFPKTVM
jgi:hypothetical protein